MSGMFRCGDQDVLLAYVYGECEPAVRDAVESHARLCEGCTTELDGLRGTRRLLASWTPPEARLGFRIAPGTDAATPPGGGMGAAAALQAGGSGWSRPLPAWAQAAAAVLIFASGLLVGGRVTPATSPAPVANGPDVRLERAVAALESRLSGLEQAQPEVVNTSDGGRERDAALLQQVRREYMQAIAASEARQRRELAVRTLQITEEQNQQQQLNNEQLEATVIQRFDGLRRLVGYQTR